MIGRTSRRVSTITPIGLRILTKYAAYYNEFHWSLDQDAPIHRAPSSTWAASSLIGGDGNDTLVFFAGSANGAIVADFERNQVDEWDFLVFSGFGTEAQGATFSQIGNTDQWQIQLQNTRKTQGWR
jgi:hypothetical protein